VFQPSKSRDRSHSNNLRKDAKYLGSKTLVYNPALTATGRTTPRDGTRAFAENYVGTKTLNRTANPSALELTKFGQDQSALTDKASNVSNHSGAIKQQKKVSPVDNKLAINSKHRNVISLKHKAP